LSYALRFVLLNFPSPAAVLALLGLSRLRQQQGVPRTLLLGGSLGACCLAGLLFAWTGDQYAFFSPILPLVALMAGLGLAAWSPRSPGLPRLALALVVAAPPLLYGWLAFGGSAPSLDREGSLDRQEFLWPARAGYQFPERWCRTRMDELPQGATLVAQWSEGTVFEYLQEQGRRPDLHIQLHRSGPLLLDEDAGPVYVSWKPTRKELPPALRELDLRLEGSQPGIRRVRR
ncbi:MAG: hypothetical protein VX498_11480, partial [Myxococcota bacterium]|nr:hypothetical protein [Myxococcota bacterium]